MKYNTRPKPRVFDSKLRRDRNNDFTRLFPIFLTSPQNVHS
jgi:hypothetical protein